jgi:hypothetical protein
MTNIIPFPGRRRSGAQWTVEQGTVIEPDGTDSGPCFAVRDGYDDVVAYGFDSREDAEAYIRDCRSEA